MDYFRLSFLEQVIVQTDPSSQCGLVRTPLGIVPEPELCAGCYSILFTGWGAPNANSTSSSHVHSADDAAEARTDARGHALPRGHCPSGDERCEVYQGYKPVCAALIRDRRASSSSSGAEPRLRPVKSDDDSGDEATGVPCEPSTIAHWFKTVITGNT